MNTAATSPLIDAATLMQCIDDPALRLFDCRFSLAQPEQGRLVYAQGHLPGASYAHLDEHLSAPVLPNTGRHPLPDPVRLAAWLGSQGVDRNTREVVYDDMGGAFAVRLWWLLRWIGLGDEPGQIRVLDGGLQAWIAAGGTLSRDQPHYEDRSFAPNPDDQLWLTTETLQTELNLGRIQIIDARAAERFRGEVEPIDPVAGHIPGAVNLPFTENLDSLGHFCTPDRLRQRFASVIGQYNPTQIIHSCGSGVNACHNLLAMELAGLPGSLLYAGSWSEWIGDSSRPIAAGDS